VDDKVIMCSVIASEREDGTDLSQRVHILPKNPLKYEMVDYEENQKPEGTPKIPTLDLNKLQGAAKLKTREAHTDSDGPMSQRSIFERKSFQEFTEKNKISLHDQKINQIIPEMLKMREEAIAERETVYKAYMQKMYN
jgi:hypothetical protein